jgi:DNA uptake protein ComE-like DNA-binding protein
VADAAGAVGPLGGRSIGHDVVVSEGEPTSVGAAVNTQPAGRARWPALSLLPLGIGAWAPIYAGRRAQVGRWVALGVVWSAITLAGWIIALVTNANDNGIGGLLILVGWIGAVATSYTVRGEYERRATSPMLQATEAAQWRLADRRRALELARSNPALAQEMGVGRPDRPGAHDAGLVDVNNAAVSALLDLPGLDGELATRIVESRAEVGGFASLEDMGAALDLPVGLVEGLRDRVVFLPRP